MTNQVRIPEVGPIVIGAGRLRLREPSPLDGLAWSRLRLDDARRLAARVEGLVPVDDAARWAEQNRPENWMTVHRAARNRIELGLGWSWAIELDNRFAGQIELTGFTRAPRRAARVGAWVGQSIAGNGVTSAALALALDHAFLTAGVEVIEAFVDSDNEHSRRGLLTMGFRRCSPDQELRSTWESPFPPDPAAELFEITPDDRPLGRASFADHILARYRHRTPRVDDVVDGSAS